MTGIAGCHYARFIQLGMLSDLDEALYFAPRDILIAPFRWVTSPSAYVRFTQRRTLSDLDEALFLERDALELRPKVHPHRARSLCHIAQ